MSQVIQDSTEVKGLSRIVNNGRVLAYYYNGKQISGQQASQLLNKRSLAVSATAWARGSNSSGAAREARRDDGDGIIGSIGQ